MGKSEKVSRVKKDKIDALRKKYDDFLEDDKRRRDRNVYILDHLEKMRSCVATMQIKQKGSITENPIYVSNSSTSNNDRIIMRQDIMNYRENVLDDNSILKEISKKYILIPKINSMEPRYPVIDMENNNDSDWKSKYNILEQLKRNEKDEPPERDVAFRSVQQDSNVLYNKHDIRSEISINSINEAYSTLKPPSNVFVDGSKFTNDHISNTNEEIPYTDKINEEPKAIKTKNSSINNNEHKFHNGIYQIQSAKNKEKDMRDNTETENILVLNNERDTQENERDTQENERDTQEKSAKNITSNKIITDINVSNQQENIVKEVKVNKLKSENNTKVKHEQIENNNKTSKEVKSLNNKEKDVEKLNNGFDDSKKFKDTQGLETKHATISDDSKANEMQLNDIESKQTEMFYSEDTKQVVEDNQGYEEPETYTTDNNYTNDQYNHYEQSQLQQAKDEPYANVINEQQEVTDNYDQNYEQQYVNSYGNEYTNQYENQPFDNYETHNNYQAENSNFEYQQPEQTNPEYNNSEGYIPTEHTPETNSSHNQENYVSQENDGQIDPQQENIEHEMHDMQHDYVEQNYDDTQQHLNVEDGYEENQNNNVNGDNTTVQHEMLEMQQHDYAEQSNDNIKEHQNVEDGYVESHYNNINGDIENNTTMQNEMHMQHDYIVQSHDENQQPLNFEGDYKESQENNVNSEIGDKTTIQHEMLDMQHEYVAQGHDGNQQQLDVEDSYVES